VGKVSKLLLTVDHQFKRTPDGSVWVSTIYDYKFWKRYLDVFDEVLIVCRVENIETLKGPMLQANGSRVEFFGLPQYRGAKEFIKKYLCIIQSLGGVANGCSHAIFRIPSPIASIVYKEVIKRKLPWAVEIVNDPWDTFKPKSVKSPIRPFVRILFTRQVKKFARTAFGVSYVTEKALQKRYPSYIKLYGADRIHFESYYSSIDLEDDYFWSQRSFDVSKKQFSIVHVNSCITDFSKGHDIVMRILKKLHDESFEIKVTFIGDGPKRKYFEEYAAELGISDFVNFTGLLSNPREVRERLIESDILVFPTMGEGLPRTIIEAMAVGLPCISTPVNGIPELLESNDLFTHDDVEGFVRRTKLLLSDSEEYQNVSLRNLSKSKEYRKSLLTERRSDFYRKLLLVPQA